MPDSFSSETYDQLCDDAEGCLSEGKIEQAREQLIKAVSLIRTRDRARSLLADACMGMELWAEARTQLESLLTIDEDNPQNIFRLGQVLEELGETELAIDNYEVVLNLQPDNHPSKVAIKRLKQDKGTADFDLEQLFASSEPAVPELDEDKEKVHYDVITPSDDAENEEDEPQEDSFILIDNSDRPEEDVEESTKDDENNAEDTEDNSEEVDILLQELGISPAESDVIVDTDENDPIAELLNSIESASSNMDTGDESDSTEEMLIGEAEKENADEEHNLDTVKPSELSVDRKEDDVSVERVLPEGSEETTKEEHIEAEIAESSREEVIDELSSEDSDTLSSIEVLFGEPDADDDIKETPYDSTKAKESSSTEESGGAEYQIETSPDTPYFETVKLENGRILLNKHLLQACEYKLQIEDVDSDPELISISGTGRFHIQGGSDELVVLEHPAGITVRKSAVVLKDTRFSEVDVEVGSDTEFVKLTMDNPLPLIIRMNKSRILEISSPNPSILAKRKCVIAFEKAVNAADADFDGYLRFSGYGKIYLCSRS